MPGRTQTPEERIEVLEMVVFGDTKMQHAGLMTRTGRLEEMFEKALKAFYVLIGFGIANGAAWLIVAAKILGLPVP